MVTTTASLRERTRRNATQIHTKPRESEAYTVTIGAKHAGVYHRGVIYGGSGYAQENLMIVMELLRAGIPVRIEPTLYQHDAENLFSSETRTALEFCKLQSIDLPNGVYFQSLPAHDFQTNLHARRLIGRTMFETDRIPNGWAEKCNALDEIWVPSAFNFETFLRAGVEEHKLLIMQIGEDTERFHPGHTPFRIPGSRGFNFLSVFQWAQRKGPDVLLKAFINEFKEDEDVALILRCYGRSGPDSDLLPELLYYIERELHVPLEKTPPIVLIPGFIPNDELPRLYTSAECFVLPTRGEGWGRPFVEALCSEMPVIATGWSGQMDFLHNANSYLIDYKLAPTPLDLELFAGQKWADPDVDHLRSLMRHVYTHRCEAKEKAQVGRKEIVEKFNRSVTMRRWSAEFERLLS